MVSHLLTNNNVKARDPVGFKNYEVILQFSNWSSVIEQPATIDLEEEKKCGKYGFNFCVRKMSYISQMSRLSFLVSSNKLYNITLTQVELKCRHLTFDDIVLLSIL